MQMFVAYIQISYSFHNNNEQFATQIVNRDLTLNKIWADNNSLKFNPTKRHFFLIDDRSNLRNVQLMENKTIQQLTGAKSMELITDSELTFDLHANLICK